jgi:hypothetical protein
MHYFKLLDSAPKGITRRTSRDSRTGCRCAWRYIKKEMEAS